MSSVSRPADDPRVVRGMTAQLDRLNAALGPGERPLGWKLAFGSPAGMERLGLDAPLVGHLVEAARVPSGAVVAVGRWANALAEPELAVHLGADVSGDADRSVVAGAIAGIGPAIELVDVDPPPDDVAAVLAGDIYQRALVLGEADPSRAGGSTEGLVGRVRRVAEGRSDGGAEGTSVGAEERVVDDVTAATGDPVDLVRHVARVLAGFGRRLEAGQVVITGSIVPPRAVHPGDRLSFELSPIGSIDVRFSE